MKSNMNLANTQFRIFDILLPLNLLNYKYKTNIIYNNDISYESNDEQSIIGRYFNEISKILPHIWLYGNIEQEFNKEAIFYIKRLEGLGFMAYLSAYKPYFNILHYDIYY